MLPAMLLFGVRTFLPYLNTDDKAVCVAKITKVRSWKLEVGSFFIRIQFEPIFKISLTHLISVEKIVEIDIFKFINNFYLFTFDFLLLKSIFAIENYLWNNL